MKSRARKTAAYRSDNSSPVQMRGTEQIRLLIQRLQSLLEELEPSKKTCAVCSKPWHRTEQRLAGVDHETACRLFGRREARRLLNDRREQKKSGVYVPRKMKFVRTVQVYIKPVRVRLDVGNRRTSALVCSEECRAKMVNGNKEYDECLIQLHDSWQQVRAIRRFLRMQSPDAFQLLRPGFGPVVNSRGSCPR